MRVNALTAGFLLTSALISFSALTSPVHAAEHKVTCLCDCPDDHKAKPVRKAEVVRTPSMTRKTVRRVARRESSYYQYAAAAPLTGYERRGDWRVAPNDMILPNPAVGCCDAPPPEAYGPPMAYAAPAPMMYGPPPGYYGPPPGEDPGIRVDDKGWSGGVGMGADGGGGGGGGFMDGFGQVHFADGGNQENGPTYNNYNQSFQYNPSVPGQFQNRLMGGLAPATTSSK